MTDRVGFTLDLNRCTGCRACELACSTENDLAFGESWRRIETFNTERDPRAPYFHLSIACNHCENAPCVAACPARAVTRDDSKGMVTLNPDRCMGCGYCAWTCPFEAPIPDESTGTMGKCTLCPDRTAEGDRPACVEACPTEALRLGNLDSPGLTGSALGFPETTAEPSLRFKPLRAGAEPLETTWTVDADVLAAFDAARRPPAVAGDLRHEWPLLVFTLAVGALVAFQTALVLGAGVPRLILALAAVTAAGISTLHLGRPERAWRAAAGFASSWLSREIVVYGVFVTLLGLQVVVPEVTGVAQTAAVVGWLTLFAVDRVYDPVRRPRSMPVHSADVLGIAALLTVVLLGQLSLALLIAGGRLLLYGLRQRNFRSGFQHRWVETAIRVILPAVGLGLMAVGGGRWAPLILVGVGEIADRLFFYLDLRPPTVAETVTSDLLFTIS
ncbi:MAG: DmsC/YnfH family molybdoenzyme membrane anchor subunit [Acidobacteriota bacterium]